MIIYIKNLLRFALYAFIISFVLYVGCGSDPEDEQVFSSEESLQNGWDKYSSAEFGAAILAFEKVLNGGGEAAFVADAYNGLGWVYLGFSRSPGVNLKNIETALSKFQEAVAHDSNNADAWVGQATLLLVRRSSQGDFQDALKAIDNALKENAEYLYRHDYYSEADLRALKAQCYYYLGEWGKARSEIDFSLSIEKNNRAALAIRELL